MQFCYVYLRVRVYFDGLATMSNKNLLLIFNQDYIPTS